MPKPKEKENAYLSYAPKVTNYIGLRLPPSPPPKLIITLYLNCFSHEQHFKPQPKENNNNNKV